jgi:hypothetical protein
MHDAPQHIVRNPLILMAQHVAYPRSFRQWELRVSGFQIFGQMPARFGDDFNALLEKPERALGMVKEEIDVRVFTRLASRRRAEQVEMLDAEPLQLGLVLLEPMNGFVSVPSLSRQPQSK